MRRITLGHRSFQSNETAVHRSAPPSDISCFLSLVMGMFRVIFTIVVLAILPVAAAAQQTPEEFWPEAQFFAQLSDRFRIRALVTRTKAKETGDFTEAGFEVDFDVGLKTILNRRLAPNPNTERGKYLTLRAGYLHVAALNDAENPSDEHRAIVELTPRYPLPAGSC